MGSAKKHAPVKLIAGFIFKDEDLFRRATLFLKRRFGGIDFESRAMPFSHTDYYAKEFGTDLKKIFISFEKLIAPDRLAGIKIFTNRVEARLSSKGLRRINIDPGYLDLSKFVLATTKDHKHRIYLSKGIYAEITLFYQDKTFRAWDWTYPDYRSEEYIEIFNRIREIYVKQWKLYT